ncbi:MAG: hypothetical protein ACPGSD_12115 [Flavobacteriales bacterium]|jgi:hypothetical protein
MLKFIGIVGGIYIVYYLGNILWDKRNIKKTSEGDNVVLGFEEDEEEPTEIKDDDDDIGEAEGDNPVLPYNQAHSVDEYLATLRSETAKEMTGIPFNN